MSAQVERPGAVTRRMSVQVAPDAAAASVAAARRAATVIRAAIDERGTARVLLASAPSQEQMLAALVTDDTVDWSRVRSFHMDEYLGLPVDHPQAFGQWLQDRLPPAVRAGFDRLRPDRDVDAEIARYTALLAAAPLDLTCLGIGMNGHIAFNEPGSPFDAPDLVRVSELDATSRRQQVEEGLFARLGEVPERAVTLTIPALLGAGAIVATVIGPHKADAVAAAVEGPVQESCPASALRTHGQVSLHLDAEAAGRLTGLG